MLVPWFGVALGLGVEIELLATVGQASVALAPSSVSRPRDEQVQPREPGARLRGGVALRDDATPPRVVAIVALACGVRAPCAHPRIAFDDAPLRAIAVAPGRRGAVAPPPCGGAPLRDDAPLQRLAAPSRVCGARPSGAASPLPAEEPRVEFAPHARVAGAATRFRAAVTRAVTCAPAPRVGLGARRPRGALEARRPRAFVGPLRARLQTGQSRAYGVARCRST